MDGLKAKLHPDKFSGKAFLQPYQKADYLIRQAVWPCGDGDAGNIRLGERLGKQLLQPVCRPVGVRIGLKIGDEAASRFFMGKKRPSGIQLGAKRPGPLCGEVAAPSGAAENAAPLSQRAVPVGAGKACVQGNLIKLFSIMLPAPGVQRPVGHSIVHHRSILDFTASATTSATRGSKASGMMLSSFS